MSELFITRHARVLQLTLNRPQARNALNNALLTQIADVLDAAALDRRSASASSAVTNASLPQGLT